MKISEMNKCIAAMRDCYNFKDDETKIAIGGYMANCDCLRVYVCTKDKNGTKIEMTKYLDKEEKQNADSCITG